MKRALLWLPLAAFVLLFAVVASGLLKPNDHLVHSQMVGKQLPHFDLPAMVPGTPGLDTARLADGKPRLINVFASWCIPCRDEHPVLVALKQQTGVRLFGMNQKDAAENATGFLKELGNPYDAIGADTNGRTSIDWGVYGVPETFIVDAKGIIRFKHVGPLTMDDIASEMIPAIEKAR